MVIDTELIEQLPYWYRQILDYQELCLAGQPTFDDVADEIIAVADNFFFQTMDAGAVAQWEQIFNIQADPSTETLEFRRARVLNRISTKPPFTLGFLYQKLDELIGPGRWEVTVDYPNYGLTIEYQASGQDYSTELAFTINRIKPAHIKYINSPLVQAAVNVAETIEQAHREYNYKLGSWGLGLLPFATETPLGVIKMPEVSSIQNKLLNDIAAFTEGDIASARLNGTVVISNITKTLDGNEVEVTYPVTQVDAITQVELLDAAGNPLTSSTLYAAVTEGTVMKHRVLVQEGVVENGQ